MKNERCSARNKKDICLRNKTFMITLKEKPAEPLEVSVVEMDRKSLES